MSKTLFKSLIDDWALTRSSRSAGVTFERWRRRSPAVASYASIVELERACLPPATVETTGRIFNELLVFAADDLLARRLLLQLLLPSLRRTSRSLQRRLMAVGERWPRLRAEFDGGDLDLEIVAACLTHIDRASGRPLTHPASILSSRARRTAWLRVGRAITNAEQLVLPLAGIDEGRVLAHVHPAEELRSLLKGAVADQIVSELDAELIWSFRVGDVSHDVLARQHGCGYEAVKKRRRRAELALARAVPTTIPGE